MTPSELRAKHPRFVYQNFHWHHANDTLSIKFQFLLEPDIPFTAQLTIQSIKTETVEQLDKTQLDNWIFHLGLIELFSYWKTAAPAEIIIEAGNLNDEQLAWWKNLLIKGMGEFFYTNQIDFTQPNFVKFANFVNQSNSQSADQPTNQPINQSTNQPIKSNQSARQIINQPTVPYLVPVGGGKDSAVVIELLEENNLPFDILLSYPQSPAAAKIAQLSRTQNIIKIDRTLDPKLFELNQAGYLNGHTPFSARLAFESSLVATLLGQQQILLGNEFSANEGNVPFHDTVINHQYSKTFEFETNFRQYVQKHLSTNINSGPDSTNSNPTPEYLSLLRPISELQIAGIFAQYSRYHAIFKSCNRNQQAGTWCEQCAKCLFVFTILYPFLEENQLIGPIFTTNLFENSSLNQLALALLGKDKHKPFECVGTYQETLAAFILSNQKFRQQHPDQPLPAVLEFVEKKVLAQTSNLDQLVRETLCFWQDQHYLNEQLAKIIQAAQKRLCQ